jgi:transcriptional regulator with XRE-family HTH domain
MKPENNIGHKIAALRSLKNIDKGDLANRSGLSADQLQLIEAGTSIPSLGVLIRISRALGIRLGSLLEDQTKEGPAIVRANDRSASRSFSTNEDLSREHLTFYSLAPNKADRHMEPFVVDIEPGKNDLQNKSSHEGEEFIFVLEGNITIVYGTEIFELKEADSIYLDSIVPHLVTTRDQHAKIVGVVYVPV